MKLKIIIIILILIIGVQSEELVLNDFETLTGINNLDKKYNVFQKSPSSASMELLSDKQTPSGKYYLKIDYDKQLEGWCGFYSLIERKNIQMYNYLQLLIKSDTNVKSFLLELQYPESEKRPPIEIDIFDYVQEGIDSWTKVIIPLSEVVEDKDDLSGINSFTIKFIVPGQSSIYIDDILFSDSVSTEDEQMNKKVIYNFNSKSDIYKIIPLSEDYSEINIERYYNKINNSIMLKINYKLETNNYWGSEVYCKLPISTEYLDGLKYIDVNIEGDNSDNIFFIRLSSKTEILYEKSNNNILKSDILQRVRFNISQTDLDNMNITEKEIFLVVGIRSTDERIYRGDIYIDDIIFGLSKGISQKITPEIQTNNFLYEFNIGNSSTYSFDSGPASGLSLTGQIDYVKSIPYFSKSISLIAGITQNLHDKQYDPYIKHNQYYNEIKIKLDIYPMLKQLRIISIGSDQTIDLSRYTVLHKKTSELSGYKIESEIKNITIKNQGYYESGKFFMESINLLSHIENFNYGLIGYYAKNYFSDGSVYALNNILHINSRYDFFEKYSLKMDYAFNRFIQYDELWYHNKEDIPVHTNSVYTENRLNVHSLNLELYGKKLFDQLFFKSGVNIVTNDYYQIFGSRIYESWNDVGTNEKGVYLKLREYYDRLILSLNGGMSYDYNNSELYNHYLSWGIGRNKLFNLDLSLSQLYRFSKKEAIDGSNYKLNIQTTWLYIKMALAYNMRLFFTYRLDIYNEIYPTVTVETINTSLTMIYEYLISRNIQFRVRYTSEIPRGYLTGNDAVYNEEYLSNNGINVDIKYIY